MIQKVCLISVTRCWCVFGIKIWMFTEGLAQAQVTVFLSLGTHGRQKELSLRKIDPSMLKMPASFHFGCCTSNHIKKWIWYYFFSGDNVATTEIRVINVKASDPTLFWLGHGLMTRTLGIHLVHFSLWTLWAICSVSLGVCSGRFGCLPIWVERWE